ncbi:MAG: cytochrome c3 family protein [Verrucomicrobiota bacterium]
MFTGLRGYLRLLFLSVAVCLLANCGGSQKANKINSPKGFLSSFDAERAERLSPEGCAECHEDSVHAWQVSHHAKANRLIGTDDVDKLAFRSETIISGKASFELNSGFSMLENREDGSIHKHKPVGVIGYTPLIQYLLPFEGGRFQTLSTAYDPSRDEWFYVFGEGDDRRLPGDWGHWTGQGNNWNANCATCHMSDYHKNYDLGTESYYSEWLFQSISCIECHQGMDQHVRLARENKPHEVAYNDPGLSMENCASCHSRRQELTKDQFKSGERYHDHFHLALPNLPGVYHGDGQVANENFVYGSLMMSRMGHKGVNCADCHKPHTSKLILPIEDNQLCMHCHGSGNKGATLITPEEHTFHKAGSSGSQCVECHMPSTPFMQRDFRRDHGFTSPDPLLTKEFGIPNSCNRCHQDKDVDWSLKWTEKWYGEKMKRRSRRRARAVEQYHRGIQDVGDELLALALDEEIDAWRAALVAMLGPWVREFKIRQFLREKLKDSSYLVRSHAIRALNGVELAIPWIEPLLKDETRSVRLDAARFLLHYNKLSPRARTELLEYMEMNADQPATSLAHGEWSIIEGKPEEALRHITRATRLDARGVDTYLDAAVLVSRISKTDQALEFVNSALKNQPGNAQAYYSRALLLAELGDLSGAAMSFQDAVKNRPDFGRAWYNLSLALNQLQRRKEAQKAIVKALEIEPENSEYQQAARALGFSDP